VRLCDLSAHCCAAVAAAPNGRAGKNAGSIEEQMRSLRRLGDNPQNRSVLVAQRVRWPPPACSSRRRPAVNVPGGRGGERARQIRRLKWARVMRGWRAAGGPLAWSRRIDWPMPGEVSSHRENHSSKHIKRAPCYRESTTTVTSLYLHVHFDRRDPEESPCNLSGTCDCHHGDVGPRQRGEEQRAREPDGCTFAYQRPGSKGP
jgi:hypothetical protein